MCLSIGTMEVNSINETLFYNTLTPSFSSDHYTPPDGGAVSRISLQYAFAQFVGEGKKILQQC